MRARFRPGLAVVLACAAGLAALPGCERDGAARPDADQGLRLLDQLEAAEVVECPFLGVLGGDPDALSYTEDQVVFRDTFPGPAFDGWFEGAFEKSALRGREREPREAVRVEKEPGTGNHYLYLPQRAGGLHRFLEAPGSESYLVQVHLRKVLADELCELMVVPLDRGPPEHLDAEALRERAPRERGEGLREQRVHAQPGKQWQTLRVLVPAQEHRRGLRISLRGGFAGVFVERVELVRLTWPDRLGLLRGQKSRPGGPLRRQLSVAQRTMDALVLPAGACIRFPLTVPETQARFDADLGALSDAAPTDLAVELRVGGVLRDRRDLRLTPGHTEHVLPSWTVPLEDLAGDSTVLELRVSGSRGAVAVLGAPQILGPAPAPGPSLLLVTLGGLRADVPGCYGSGSSCTPTLDRLAAEGTRFASVYSVSSATLPALATVLTGQDPVRHGVLAPPARLGLKRSGVLAERLRLRGYQTAAFLHTHVLEGAVGLGAGFSLFSLDSPSPSTGDGDSPDVVDAALEWLHRRGDQPYFLWVHLGLDLDALESPGDASSACATDLEHSQRLRARYEERVGAADSRELATLVTAVDRAGPGGSTLVCVVGDHGFELLEHGSVGAGEYLWEPLVRVPWVLRGPGVAAGHSVPAPVGLVDVAPTLAALLGLPGEGSDDGRNVLGAPGEPRAFFFSTVSASPHGAWEGVCQGVWKLLRQQLAAPLLPRDYLYHLEWDPAEIHDLLEHNTDVAFDLRGKLEAHAVLVDDSLSPPEDEAGELPRAWATPEGPGARPGN